MQKNWWSRNLGETRRLRIFLDSVTTSHGVQRPDDASVTDQTAGNLGE
ncbi:hypothetical protein BANT918_00948 [Brevibacterium antiquum CNRZ 918]|uniref:Uncharacterized protein n=1 Tax=Brevibacterium antiquum CNRZ 918 TaxID=1255637 RepID=A0A2H1IFS4_9MICO|nr:hypothetical protein BANT918_00948 [Brevibacterium antiquum CNRZ 918]